MSDEKTLLEQIAENPQPDKFCDFPVFKAPLPHKELREAARGLIDAANQMLKAIGDRKNMRGTSEWQFKISGDDWMNLKEAVEKLKGYV